MSSKYLYVENVLTKYVQTQTIVTELRAVVVRYISARGVVSFRREFMNISVTLNIEQWQSLTNQVIKFDEPSVLRTCNRFYYRMVLEAIEVSK